MPSSDLQALVAIWINVPAEHREEFRQWHNCEHSTERLMGPGFRICHRYNAVNEGEHHDILNIFEGDTLDAFGSRYYHESRNNPSPWTRACMSFIRDAERAVYELKASCGLLPRFDAPYVHIVRLNPAAGRGAEEELIDWYREESLPRLCAVEGVLRGRLFRKAEALSAGETAESRIQGTRTGDRACLSLFEMETLDPLGTPAWHDAAFGTPRGFAMRERIKDVKREHWWLDFAKWAPEGRD